VPGHQGERGAGPDRGEHLRAGAAAELAGEQGGQQDRRHRAEHRRDPDAPQVVAEERDAEPGQQRGEGRLVHVPPVGMVGQQPEVELVAVVPVLVDGGHQQRGDR
jgi:hypothetical protein